MWEIGDVIYVIEEEDCGCLPYSAICWNRPGMAAAGNTPREAIDTLREIIGVLK